MKLSLYLLTTIFVCLHTGLLFGQSSISTDQLQYRVVALHPTQPGIESVSNSVTLALPLRLFVPNAFTPDGDGLNDEFGPVGQGVNRFYLRIFNRWGELLYESPNAGDTWNGRYQGREVPTGSYIYEIIASGHGTPRMVRRGTVMLHRENAI